MAFLVAIDFDWLVSCFKIESYNTALFEKFTKFVLRNVIRQSIDIYKCVLSGFKPLILFLLSCFLILFLPFFSFLYFFLSQGLVFFYYDLFIFSFLFFRTLALNLVKLILSWFFRLAWPSFCFRIKNFVHFFFSIEIKQFIIFVFNWLLWSNLLKLKFFFLLFLFFFSLDSLFLLLRLWYLIFDLLCNLIGAL